MSGLHYAFIPDRVDSSALMHRQTHSLGKPPRRSSSPPPPSSSSASSLLFPQPLTSSPSTSALFIVAGFSSAENWIRLMFAILYLPPPPPRLLFFFKRGKTALVSVGFNMEQSHQYGNVSNLRDNPAVLSFNFFFCSHLVSILEAALFSQILRLLQ